MKKESFTTRNNQFLFYASLLLLVTGTRKNTISIATKSSEE